MSGSHPITGVAVLRILSTDRICFRLPIVFDRSYKAQHASDSEALLAERGRIDNSHQMMDRTLE